MSADLRTELTALEADFFNQPPVCRAADLDRINRLRTALDLPTVTADDLRPKPPSRVAVRQPQRAPARDHTAARAIYDRYLCRKAELAPHVEYADRVVRATAGVGQTPVAPLATMGTGGGCLLCDACRQPIVLEGGRFHKVPVDRAWAVQPEPMRVNWRSWIYGGMVVETVSNKTLRIYHGYMGNPSACCSVGLQARRIAEAAFRGGIPDADRDALTAFFADEFADRTDADRAELLLDVIDVLYDFDPGIGINHPTPTEPGGGS